MPCFKARVLASRCSSAAISASMSDITAAIAVCSFGDGNESLYVEICGAVSCGTPSTFNRELRSVVDYLGEEPSIHLTLRL